MSEYPVVSHFRSTDLIQPLKDEQPDTVHFKGSFKPRRFKSNPDLVALKAVEQNRFDRIPSPPVCGPEVMLMHRKLNKINPRLRRVENTCLFVRPRSFDSKDCNAKGTAQSQTLNETSEIEQLCQGFSSQMSVLK